MKNNAKSLMYILVITLMSGVIHAAESFDTKEDLPPLFDEPGLSLYLMRSIIECDEFFGKESREENIETLQEENEVGSRPADISTEIPLSRKRQRPITPLSPDAAKTKPVCNICTKHFSSMNALRVHIRSMHDGEIHQCSYCNQRFKYKGNVKRHIASVHEGVKYACLFCKACFTDKSALHTHNKNIHEKKIHVCQSCMRQFTDYSSLRRHIRNIHEKATYSCPSCDKVFTDKNNLMRHIENIHNKARHTCSVCKRMFGIKSDLKRHMRAKHEDI